MSYWQTSYVRNAASDEQLAFTNSRNETSIVLTKRHPVILYILRNEEKLSRT